MSVSLETRYLESFVRPHELGALQPQVTAAHELLHAGSGLGSDFLGWLTLPTDYDKEEFARIQAAAARIRQDTDIFIAIGIGGSYLGARAAIEFLKSPLYNAKKKDTPDVYFAGNSISSAALSELLELCEGRRVSINVISKSGTTTEPAIAFRVFRDYLEKTVGREEAKKRIYVTTDKARGTLKGLADREGYETFVVPDDVGGRFSVLTAVGLLPIAVAGCDIAALMAGAAAAHDHQIGRKLFLGALGFTLGGRGHQGVHTAAGLLHAVGHSVKNGVGGKGSAGHAVDGQRLRRHDLAGQLVDGGGADAGGLGVLGHHDGLDGALGKGHLNGDVAVHAAAGRLARAGGGTAAHALAVLRRALGRAQILEFHVSKSPFRSLTGDFLFPQSVLAARR